MKKDFKHVNYQLTDNPKEADHPYQYSDNFVNSLYKYNQMASRGNAKVVPRLVKMIKKHPRVPALLNCLSCYYKSIDNSEKAYALNQRVLDEFPDYFLGKINKVTEYYEKEEFEKIPSILGEALNLQALYPNRKVFHLNEFTPFNTAVVYYLIATEQFAALSARLPMLTEVLGADDKLVKHAKLNLSGFDEDNK